MARLTSPGADRTVSPTDPGVICEPLRPAEVEDKDKGRQQYPHPRGRGADVGMIQAAEGRRRSRSITGTLEGDAFKKDRVAQVIELDGVIAGLTGGELSSYEKLEEYERRIAIMREASKEANVENTRAGYWQGVELWNTQKAMQTCISAHHWKPLLQYSLATKEEVRASHTYQSAWQHPMDYRGLYPNDRHLQGTAEDGFIAKTTLVVSKFAYHRSDADTLKMRLSAKGRWAVPNQRIIAINVPRRIMSEAGTRPSYTPGLIQAVRKATGKEQAGLDEEDMLQILQSIGYEGRLYIRFITHEDAKAYKHSMGGKYLFTGDKKALEVDWAENDCVAHNNSKFADPYQLNLPRSFELVWVVPPGPFFNMATKGSAKAIVGFLHPLGGLHRKKKKANRPGEAASAGKGEQPHPNPGQYCWAG